MQYGKNTSINLLQNETVDAVSGQLATFANWNKRLIIRGAGTAMLWMRRSRQRSELRQLLGRGDHFFQDTGLSRATLHIESSKWFWQG